MQRENQWLQDYTVATPISGVTVEALKPNEVDLRASLQETFNSFLREAKLIRTYSELYNERSKTGVSEGFALVNQRDAEVCEHRSHLVAGSVSLMLSLR